MKKTMKKMIAKWLGIETETIIQYKTEYVDVPVLTEGKTKYKYTTKFIPVHGLDEKGVARLNENLANGIVTVLTGKSKLYTLDGFLSMQVMGKKIASYRHGPNYIHNNTMQEVA